MFGVTLNHAQSINSNLSASVDVSHKLNKLAKTLTKARLSSNLKWMFQLWTSSYTPTLLLSV